MAVKLHRCSNIWVKVGGHPCWKIERALQDMGIEYERATGPLRRSKRDELQSRTGQRLYPAIELEDGTWYHEESKDMEKTIRDGRLMEQATGPSSAASG